MTQPDGFFPTSAANYGSLAEFAAKTQTDWEAGLVAAETDRYSAILSGLFGSMPGGQPFILTLITELCKKLLGLDPTTFFASLEDAWNSLSDWATSVWAKSAEQWAAIGTQINALWTLVTGGPVSAAAWATWWSNFLIAIGVGSTDAAAIANFLSGNYDAAITAKANWTAFMAAWGIGTPADVAAATAASQANWTAFMAAWGIGTPADVAAATAASQAKWTSFMAAWGIGTPADVATATANSKSALAAFLASIGLGSMTAAGAQLAGNNTAITSQAGWWSRMAEDLWIIYGDGLHIYYPLGTPSDTPTTTSGGRRTWYSAQADWKQLWNDTKGTTAPTAVGGDVGTLATATQTTVIVNEGTLATVQAKVDELISSDSSVAGTKITSASSGTGNQWGSNWTVTGTSGYTIKNDSGAFAWDTQVSAASDMVADGYYNVKDVLTDDVIVSAVFLDGTKVDGAGAVGPWNTLKARRNAAGTEYIWARAIRNQVTLGYAVGGTEHLWATYSVNVPAGALLELQCGTAAGHRIYQVRVNGVNQAPYTEVGTSSVLGSSNRKGGQDQKATRGVFGDQWPPSRIRQWGLKDTNVTAVTYGTSARFYRNTTTSTAALPKGAASGLTTNVFNATEYCSPDIQLLGGGIAFYTAGRYLIEFTVRFDAALATGCAAGIMRYTGSPVIYAEGINYSTASLFGLEGHFVINAIGDGTATEVWYPLADLAGSGSGPGIKGDGAGLSTWLTITRIG